MDRPLGKAIGNALEVVEAVRVLEGRGAEDLTAVCVELAANMLSLAGKGDLVACRSLAERQIENGEGLAKLLQMVEAQGGNPHSLEDFSLLPQPGLMREVRSARSGRVFSMNTERCGIASVALGGGRIRKEDGIDYAAGIVLERKTGDRVEVGETLARIYAADEDHLDEGERLLASAYEIRDEKPAELPHFFARVSSSGIDRY